jgi:hypothetical protein
LRNFVYDFATMLSDKLDKPMILKALES